MVSRVAPATPMASPGAPLNILDCALRPYEREYVRRQLNERDRRLIRKRLTRRRGPRLAEEPLRIQVIRSSLPEEYRSNLFHELECRADEKTVEMARSVLRIPYGSYSRPPASLPQTMGGAHEFLERARAQMDASILGHDEAKREVLITLAQWMSGSTSPFALALEGPPGIGKTTFVKHALAAVLGRPMSVVCLGGASDVSYLLGHGFTYEGARHGRLVQSLMECGVMDCVLFFDELDKISNSPRGEEIVNALIHLTDPQQNTQIRDRYFQGLDIDFSRCVMVFSYNDARKVSPVLLDRLKRIALHAPTRAEKVDIARSHILPRLQRHAGGQISVSDDAVALVVDEHSDDQGMRGIERSLHDLLGVASLCWQHGSTSIAGIDMGDEFSPGHVKAEFAQKVLQTRRSLDVNRHAGSAPPPTMFT